MDCHDIDRFLYLYLDGEFDPGEARSLEEHMHNCSRCRGLVSAELRFQEGLRRRLGTAPKLEPERRDRIVRKVLDHGAAREGFLAWLTRPPVLVGAGALASLLLVLGLWTMMPERSAEFESVINESVAVHETELPPEVEGNKEQIIKYVKARASFKTEPPNMGPEARLLSARLTRVGSQQAVLYKYLVNGRPISVVQMPMPAGVATPDGGSPKPRRLPYVGDRRGHGVTLFEQGGLRNAAVGRLPGKDLIRLVPASYRK